MNLCSVMDRNSGTFHPKMEERGSSGTAWHTPDDNNIVFNFCLDSFIILHFTKTA